MASKIEKGPDEHGGRRTSAERRARELSIVHGDRRRSERRSGTDRRSDPRD